MLLTDDHRLVREGLRRILEARIDLRVAAEAGNGEERCELALQEGLIAP